jgi:hypothetical protein
LVLAFREWSLLGRRGPAENPLLGKPFHRARNPVRRVHPRAVSAGAVTNRQLKKISYARADCGLDEPLLMSSVYLAGVRARSASPADCLAGSLNNSLPGGVVLSPWPRHVAMIFGNGWGRPTAHDISGFVCRRGKRLASKPIGRRRGWFRAGLGRCECRGCLCRSRAIHQTNFRSSSLDALA